MLATATKLSLLACFFAMLAAVFAEGPVLRHLALTTGVCTFARVSHDWITSGHTLRPSRKDHKAATPRGRQYFLIPPGQLDLGFPLNHSGGRSASPCPPYGFSSAPRFESTANRQNPRLAVEKRKRRA